MKRLYGTTDPAEAEQLRALLKAQGIETTLEPDGGIHVRDEDAPAAAEALARHFEKETGSEAPPPAPGESPEHDHRRRFRRRLLLLLILFFPGVLAFAMWFPELWQKALAGAAGILSLAAVVWVADLIAESRENKTGPPPDSGSGPVDDSSEST